MARTVGRWLKQCLVWGALVSVVAFTVFPIQRAWAETDLEERVEEALDKVIRYYSNSDNDYAFAGFDWELTGLARAGEDLQLSKWQDKSGQTAIDYWASKVEDETDPGQLAKLAIGLMYNGYDPTDFNAVNLLENIAGQQEANGRIGDDTWDIFDQALAIIALEMYGYEYDEEAAVEYLLNRYRQFDTIDDWAFTLNALSLLDETDEVEEAKANIVEKLKTSQNENGAYLAWGSESPDSTIQALLGLAAIGEDVFASPWNKSVEYVLSNQTEDGGFQSPWSGGASSAITTEQALNALVAMDRGEPLFQRLNDSEKEELKTYVPTVDLTGKVDVYDGLADYLIGKTVTPSAGTFSVSGKQVMIRAHIADVADEDKPLAVLIKAMEGNQVADVAVLEAGTTGARQVAADLRLDSGTYRIEIHYWYGLSEKPEIAKPHLSFQVKVR